MRPYERIILYHGRGRIFSPACPPSCHPERRKRHGAAFLRSRNRQIKEHKERAGDRREATMIWWRAMKNPTRNQKRFHSRYNFGYGILLSIRKTPHFRPFTAYFGGFEGVFSYKTDKSAILCPGKTETADFVSFKGSIVQGIKITSNEESFYTPQ